MSSGIGSTATFLKPDKGRYFRFMDMNSIGRIACATMLAASLFLMSACTIAPYYSLESEAFLAPESNISQLAANDSFNQCNEQTRLLKHEVALCRAVPLIRVPLD
jgi:hypothetical protein